MKAKGFFLGLLALLGGLGGGLGVGRAAATSAQCGTCERCNEVCPTRAVVAP